MNIASDLIDRRNDDSVKKPRFKRKKPRKRSKNGLRPKTGGIVIKPKTDPSVFLVLLVGAPFLLGLLDPLDLDDLENTSVEVQIFFAEGVGKDVDVCEPTCHIEEQVELFFIKRPRPGEDPPKILQPSEKALDEDASRP